MSTFKFIYFQNFAKKRKRPKNVSKNTVFIYFYARISKHCFNISNQHYEICLKKFHEKTKNPEFWTKNPLL